MSEHSGYKEYHYWKCNGCEVKLYDEVVMKRHDPRKCVKEAAEELSKVKESKDAGCRCPVH